MASFMRASWLEIIFNPSFPYRFVHMVLASALTCAFLLIGISAWQLLKGVATASASRVLRTGLVFAALAAPAQMVAGDFHGLNTLQHQPQKIAAMEGIWETNARRAAAAVSRSRMTRREPTVSNWRYQNSRA